MRLTEVTYRNASPIDGYGPGFFRVGGKAVTGAVLISPAGLASWSGFEDLGPVLAAVGNIDVLFVGTGAEIAPLPKTFRETLEAEGLGVETMATPPACRTYNVLLSEGRRIGAALLPV